MNGQMNSKAIIGAALTIFLIPLLVNTAISSSYSFYAGFQSGGDQQVITKSVEGLVLTLPYGLLMAVLMGAVAFLQGRKLSSLGQTVVAVLAACALAWAARASVTFAMGSKYLDFFIPMLGVDLVAVLIGGFIGSRAPASLQRAEG